MSILKDKSRYPHPTSHLFDAEPWSSAMADDSINPDERRLAEIALAVGEALGRVRSDSISTFDKLPADRTLRIAAYVSFLNGAAVELYSKNYEIESGRNPFETALHGKISGVSETGDVGLDEALAWLLDSARFPLYELMHREDGEFSGDGSSDLKETIQFHFKSGQQYLAWFDLWQDVIFRGLSLDGEDDLVYGNISAVEATIVADYRIRRRMIAFALHSDQVWKDTAKEIRKSYRRPIVGLSKDGLIRFRKSNLESESAPIQFIFYNHAEMELSREVLRARLPNYGGASVDDMIVCWRAVSYVISDRVRVLSDYIRESVKRGEDWDINPNSTIFPFDKLELVGDISRVTGISRGVVVRIVDAMTYKGSSVESLWSTPFIEIPDGRLLALCIPFVSGVYLYPARSWLKNGGGDQSEKGYRFEDELHDLVVGNISTNYHLSSWSCLKNCIIKCSARDEEVDMLLLTGDSVYVVEAKCFIPGYEPREVDRYMRSVAGAVKQAARKAANLSKSRDALSGYLDSRGLGKGFDLTDCPVRPLVVTFHPMGAGFGTDDCPVVDPVILRNFLENETASAFVSSSAGTRRLSKPSILYSNADEANSRFWSYMKQPPELEEYRNQIVPRIIRFVSPHDGRSFNLNFLEVGPNKAESEAYARYFSEPTSEAAQITKSVSFI